VIATIYFCVASVCFNKVASNVSQQGVGATYYVVAIVLLSIMFNFIELVWTRLGTYDFLGP